MLSKFLQVICQFWPVTVAIGQPPESLLYDSKQLRLTGGSKQQYPALAIRPQTVLFFTERRVTNYL